MSACPHTRGAVYFLGSVLCRNKHKRAMTARFLSVAKGNISRGGQTTAVFHVCATAQTFHRRGSVPGLLTCLLRGLCLGLVEA